MIVLDLGRYSYSLSGDGRVIDSLNSMLSSILLLGAMVTVEFV